MTLNINTNKTYKDFSFNEYAHLAIIRVAGSYAIVQVSQRISNDEVKVLVQINGRLFSTWQVALEEMVYEQGLRGNKAASELSDLDICLKVLGLTVLVSVDQIKSAFRTQVKSAATGNGHYTRDMDKLVQAKEFAMSQFA